MSKMRGLLAAIIPLALMAESGFGMNDKRNNIRPEDIDVKLKRSIIPKGCKKYYFDEVGNCLYDVKHDTAVFSCIAINEKSAIKKFSKWLADKMKQGVV